ncbi:MAG TPA: antibiotic biosynthesis monooxygenase [Chloroflexota bacterium]|nr:antibiotic biosynthesis monooxygenase [Chloroflexota bacterium]
MRANEPGTLLYVAMRDAEDENGFLHVMAFADEAAEQAHRTSAPVQRFVEVLYPETVDGVAFRDYVGVAAT